MTVTLTQIADRIDKVPGAIRLAVRQGVTELGRRGQRLVKEGYLSGARLAVRTGSLRGSVTMATESTSSSERVYLRAGGGQRDVRYAVLQEDGGTVVPSGNRPGMKEGHTPHLAIPLAAAKTRAGVSKYASPRDIPGLFVIKSKAGNLLLVRKIGKKGKIQPMFVLKQSVTIKGKHYMRDALTAMSEAAPEVINKAVDTALARVVS